MVSNGMLYIDWYKGSMMVRLNAFLPAPQAKLKKLLKINALDLIDREENICQMIDYVKNQIKLQGRIRTRCGEIYNAKCIKTIEKLEKNLDVLRKELKKYE